MNFFWQVIGTISIELHSILYSGLEDLLPCQYMHCSEQERVIVSFRTLCHRDTSQVNMNETKYLWMGILIYKGYLSYHRQEPLRGFHPGRPRKDWFITIPILESGTATSGTNRCHPWMKMPQLQLTRAFLVDGQWQFLISSGAHLSSYLGLVVQEPNATGSSAMYSVRSRLTCTADRVSIKDS
jgi:hypothetical protein